MLSETGQSRPGAATDSAAGTVDAAPVVIRSKPASAIRRSLLGPLLLFGLFGAFYTVPPQGGDRPYHLSYIIEARAALKEGQFPIRVSPRALDGQRYPTFQFYGNFPYTAPALLMLVTGMNAYTAWKVMTFLTVALAGIYTYLCSLTLTRQVWPSVVAGVVFVAAPYLAADVRARFAYTEAVSFCLLPAVLYYSLRAFVAPRWGAVVKGGVAWSLVALSHNITYLYGSALVCLFFLSLAAPDLRKYTRRMLRVGACYAVGLVLSLWYVAPQLKALNYLGIAASNSGQSPLWSTMWAPPDVLFSPVLKVPDAPGSTPYVGLQVGWTIFAAALLSLALLVQLSRRGLRRGLQIRLLLSLALAFFIVWSPVDFWRYVPALFYNVQMTFRVLMFVVLWGSLLAGVALAAAFGRRGGMRPAAGLALVLAVGLAAMPNTVWGRSRFRRTWLAALESRHDFGPGVGMYLPLTERLSNWRIDPPPGVPVLHAADVQPRVRTGKSTQYGITLAERTVVQLPVLFYPGLHDVRDAGRPVRGAGQLDGLLALDLAPGEHRIRVRFEGVRWANVTSAALWLGVAALSVATLVRRVRKLRAGVRGNSKRRAPPPRPPAAFPASAAVVCFALLALPMTLPAGADGWHKYSLRRAVGKLTASSECARELEVQNAFDENATTAWAAAGSGPAWLTVEPRAPRRVSRIRLEARQTTLLETWHTVRVVLYRGGRMAAEQSFSLPDAATRPAQEVTLDAPAEADRIELYFSDPVSVMPDGRRIDARLCNPGYAEIRID